MTAGTRPITAAPAARAASRDLRLDLFRGVAMVIILIAHIPDNRWTLWIPARFGFSDATEIFVFCSGLASGLAFGASYARRGWLLGTLRILHRIWQIYWVHLGVFIAVLALAGWATSAGVTGRDYVGALNLHVFFAPPDAAPPWRNVAGLMTLTYVPNYFDILPMYAGILAMMPLVVALGRLAPGAAPALCAVFWIGALGGWLRMPAEPWSDREWFFNPFGWQILFFLGFAYTTGRIPPPPRSARIAIAALVIVLISIPVTWHRIHAGWPAAAELFGRLAPMRDKTDFGPLRLLHFLSLAYLAWWLSGPGRGEWLSRLATHGNPALTLPMHWLCRIGQQSLAVFAVSMVLAQVLGIVLDLTGRTPLPSLAVNLAGIALLLVVAELTALIRSRPWRERRG